MWVTSESVIQYRGQTLGSSTMLRRSKDTGPLAICVKLGITPIFERGINCTTPMNILPIVRVHDIHSKWCLGLHSLYPVGLYGAPQGFCPTGIRIFVYEVHYIDFHIFQAFVIGITKMSGYLRFQVLLFDTCYVLVDPLFYGSFCLSNIFFFAHLAFYTVNEI